METVQKLEQEKKIMYKEEGQVTGAMQGIVTLVLLFGIAVILYVFVGVIAGQTYELTESDIDAISNSTISGNIKGGIVKGFEGYKQLGNYMPLLILALILGVILAVLLSIVAFTGVGVGGRGGSVL